MLSAAEAELGALFITSKEIVLISHTLIDIGWPHPPSPIKIDNSTAVGVVNDTNIARKIKYMGTGPLDPTIGPTTDTSTTHLFTTKPSAPYLQALLRNFTKPF